MKFDYVSHLSKPLSIEYFNIVKEAYVGILYIP